MPEIHLDVVLWTEVICDPRLRALTLPANPITYQRAIIPVSTPPREIEIIETLP